MAAPPIAERHLPHFHRRAPMKEACRAATTANITISTALNNGDSIDGITLATGDRVLVKNQTAGAENGIYEVGVSPARAYDLSTDDPSFGFLVYVREGTTNGGTLWENTNTSAPTIATTALTFSQVTGGGSSFATPSIVLGSSAAAGAASTVIRSDSTIAAFDATAPTTQAFGDAAAVGAAAFAARRDHKHAWPTAAVTTSGLTQATARLLGRTTASTGAIEEITVGSGLTLSAGSLTAPGGTGTLTTIEEVDGSPTDSAVTKLVFPNGTLAIASHVATYTPTSSGAPTSAEYITSASDGTLSAEVNIPGLAGSVDIKSAGGSDDEFDASGLSGWTSFGSPDTSDSDTTRLSHVYLKKNAASGAHAAGIYKANPSMPFTMTAKLAACALRADFNMAGIFVGVANPAAGAFKASLLQHGGVAGNINTGVIAWTNPTTYNGAGTYANVPNGPPLPVYLRIIATSSTNVTFGFSYDGRFYKDVVSSNNPGFTIGSVGLLVNPDNASNAGEADFDWIRFT